VVEFSSSGATDVVAAKAATDWASAGRFCGNQGPNATVSALLSFNTADSGGKQAPWMRFRLQSDNGSPMNYQGIGEVVVLQKH
jgi:hypothetical protein